MVLLNMTCMWKGSEGGSGGILWLVFVVCGLLRGERIVRML